MRLFIFDIKYHIACFNEESWYNLYLYDPIFREYAITDQGIKKYKDLFTKITIYGDKRTKYRLFGKLHRDNDQPAVIYANDDQYWYQNGKQHRDNNQPAVIYANGNQYWYQNGISIR